MSSYLEYMPPPISKEERERFDRQVADIVGLNPATSKPWIRFVWGCDRMEDFTPEGEEELRRYPDYDDKYVGAPYWIIEGWQDPSVLNRDAWEAGKETLGPFPVNGTWDFIETLRTAEFEFINLGSIALDKAATWRIWKNKPKHVAVEQLLYRHKLRRELAHQRKVEASNKIWDKFQDDYVRAYENKDKNPHSVSGAKGAYKTTPAGLVIPNS